MYEPWLSTLCQTPECLAEALDERGNVRPGYYLSPDLDTEFVTQFTCPRCGKSETWGITRRQVAKTLYERLSQSRR